MKRLVLILALILSVSTATPAIAKGGFSSSSSSSRSSSSSSSKSYSSGSSSKSSGSSGKCCSSSSKTSSSSKSGGSSKTYSNGAAKPSKPTAAAPSSGSRPAKPITRTVPKLPPPAPKLTTSGRSVTRVTVPRGRNFYRDRTFLISHPGYGDPYGRSYYGAYSYGSNNPYFYMWLYAMMDNDRSNNPAPPESDGQVSDALVSFAQIIVQEQAITAAK